VSREVSPIRVGVNGAAGRMGRATCRWVEEAPDLELVARTDRDDDLRDALASSEVQVCVDFTVAEVRMKTAAAIVEAGVRPVLGTSGFRAEDVTSIAERCAARGIGGLVVPNFSIGAVLMIELSARAARHLSAVEILETHHATKTDAPSGTALATAARLRAVLGEGHEIPIHSVRLPGFHSRQEVVLGGTDERLVVGHEAISPEAFREGVLLSIRHAPRLDRLVFGLASLLGLA